MGTQGTRAIILATVFALATTGVVYISVVRGLPLEMVFLALMGCGVLGYAAMRAPELLLVGCVFAPQWKTYRPLIYIDRITDLTLVMLGCLLAYLVWRLLLRTTRIDRYPMEYLMVGQGWPILCFLIFTASVTCSYFYTIAPQYGGDKLLRFLGIGSLMLVAPLVLICTSRDWLRFARLFVACSAITAVQLIVGLRGHVDTGNGDITRIGAGWLIGMAITIVLFHPLFQSHSVQLVFLICALPLLSAGLIASAARGPTAALAVVLVIRTIVWVKEGSLQTAFIVAAVLAVSAAGSYLVLRNAARSRYTAKATELINLLKGDSTNGSAGARLEFYDATIAAIPDDLLLGHGVGSWSVFYYGRDERGYPHNLFLEIAFEQGLLGLGTWFLFFAVLGASFMELQRQTDSQFLVLGIVILYSILISMFSGDLDDNRLIWLWAGILMAVCRNAKLQQHLAHTGWFSAPGYTVTQE